MKSNELTQAVVSLDRIKAKVDNIETQGEIASLRELMLAGLDLALWEESDSIAQYEAKKAECSLFHD